ncbi:uncharacterized protein LOC117118784 [Anneissia japonica]|uniref:uncharacterized protein LOC117118784 n=1 Tax=Anneissia japonica TaxID=1529436 RepID=UPI0014255647|nr:uncharacterized protein LOC117118784 [Anneissia japonica]
MYVGNRVQQIHNLTDVNSWNYVESNQNPSDDASRGLSVSKLLFKSIWLSGPAFLKEDGDTQCESQVSDVISKEFKKSNVLTTSNILTTSTDQHNDVTCINKWIYKFSSWSMFRIVIAYILNLKKSLMNAAKVKCKQNGVMSLFSGQHSATI